MGKRKRNRRREECAITFETPKKKRTRHPLTPYTPRIHLINHSWKPQVPAEDIETYSIIRIDAQNTPTKISNNGIDIRSSFQIKDHARRALDFGIYIDEEIAQDLSSSLQEPYSSLDAQKNPSDINDEEIDVRLSSQVKNHTRRTLDLGTNIDKDIHQDSSSSFGEPYLSSGSEYKPSDDEREETCSENLNERGETSDEERDTFNIPNCVNNETPTKILVHDSNERQELVDSARGPVEREHLNVLTKMEVTTKKQCCPYCKKKIVKFARHLGSKHSEEADVSHFLAMPVGSLQRKDAITQIRNRGNFFHNMHVFSTGEDNLIVKRRPERTQKKGTDFLPCQKCLGLYARHTLYRHAKVCDVSKKKWSRVQSASAALLPIHGTASKALREKVLVRMKEDSISNEVKRDRLILLFGSNLINKYGHEQHLFVFISTKMRELARLSMKLKELNPTIKELSDIFYPKFFDSLITAVQNLTGFDSESGCFKIPALALKLGHSLKKCTDILIFESIKQENMQRKAYLEQFKQIFEVQWLPNISKHASDTLYRAKWNQKSLIPLADDIKKLNLFLNTRASELVENLSNKFQPSDYDDLSKIILAKLILFNRRRVGEVQRITVDSFTAKKTMNPSNEIYQSLSNIEKKIAGNFYHVEVRGKRGRKVPILMTQDTVCKIDLLINLRSHAGISNDNRYVFGRGCFGYLRGCDVLRFVAKSCGASKPENLTSTRLRKHVATMCQILNLKEHEMDQLATFMGHDIKIHRQYYRMSDDNVHLAKISKLLLAFESGKIAHYKGKCLDDIDLDIDDADESENDSEDNENINVNNTVSENIDAPQTISKAETKSYKSKNMREQPSVIPPESQPMANLGTSNKKINKTTKLRKISTRRSWSDAEKKAVWRQLPSFMYVDGLPGKSECLQCVANEKILSSRSWTQIKDFVRNYQLRRR